MPIISPNNVISPISHGVPLAEFTPESRSVFLDNNTEISDIAPHLEHLDLVVVDFPNITDGRGLSLAKALRNIGYTGVLRAKGEITPDQYPMALLCGFNEVEISEERLKRQPREQWEDVSQVHLWRERLGVDSTQASQAA